MSYNYPHKKNLDLVTYLITGRKLANIIKLLMLFCPNTVFNISTVHVW